MGEGKCRSQESSKHSIYCAEGMRLLYKSRRGQIQAYGAVAVLGPCELAQVSDRINGVLKT